MTKITWPSKDPNEVKDYSWVVPVDEGDEIASFTYSGGDGPVTVQSQANTEDTITLWLSGGVDGDEATFTLLVTTIGGRVFEAVATIGVAANSTIAPSADSYYGSVEGYRSYHIVRGRAASDPNSRVLEALLIASEWLDGSYSWPGYKYRDRNLQTRAWPRSHVTDADGWDVAYDVVPVEIEQATYEVAYRWLIDPTVLTPDHTPEKYSSVSIDGALSVKYRGLDAQQVQKQFPILGIILGRLTGGSGGSSLSSSMSRA